MLGLIAFLMTAGWSLQDVAPPARPDVSAPVISAGDLVGTWVVEPFSESRDGITVRMRDTSGTYETDGTSSFEGIIVIEGPGEFRGGAEYRVTSRGLWRLDGSVVYDQTTIASVRPVRDHAVLQSMANMMEAEMLAEAETSSDIVDFTGDRMRMRDRRTGRVWTINRSRARP